MKFNFVNISNINDYYKSICEFIVIEANCNIKSKGHFSFVLSGGKSPKYIFDKIASDYLNQVDWEKVDFFWVDERVISFDSPDSNFKLANDFLFSKFKFKPKIFHIKFDQKDHTIVEEYQKLIFRNAKTFLNELPSFDLIMLGMGEDGHIASIFPNISKKLSKKNIFSTKIKINGFVRISFGFPLINNSKKIVLIANNQKKYKILTQDYLKLPVHKLNIPQTIVFTNET